MNRTQRPEPQRPRRSRRVPAGAQIAAPVLGILCVVLAVLTAVFYLQNTYLKQEAEETRAEASASVSELEQELQQTLDSTIPISEFKANAASYNVSAEFIQQFFDDVVVYKDETIVYAPIDPELPKNSYDWSSLKRENGRFSYEPEGGVHARLGIDVSRFQGDIDWEKVAADGIQFAMIRMGYRGYGSGDLVTDEAFHQNMEGALENGLQTGVYFFSQAITEEEAIEEAEYLLAAIDGYDLRMPVVFDMEMVTESDTARANSLTPQQRTAITKAFCRRIEEAGYTAMIYGNPAWLLSKIQLKELTDYPVWLAQYYREPFFPYSFSIWQYTNTGRVDGISGSVDLSLCFVSGW